MVQTLVGDGLHSGGHVDRRHGVVAGGSQRQGQERLTLVDRLPLIEVGGVRHAVSGIDPSVQADGIAQPHIAAVRGRPGVGTVERPDLAVPGVDRLGRLATILVVGHGARLVTVDQVIGLHPGLVCRGKDEGLDCRPRLPGN